MFLVGPKVFSFVVKGVKVIFLGVQRGWGYYRILWETLDYNHILLFLIFIVSVLSKHTCEKSIFKVWSILLLRFMASDYPFWYLQTFLSERRDAI